MNGAKKKRGRPRENGSKNKKIQFRVTKEQYDSFKKLCDLEGESLTDYILESIRIRGNLTKSRHAVDEIEDVYGEIFTDKCYEDDYLEDA